MHEGAVRAAELEKLTFTPAGLVHWLVVDVVSGIATRNGQREDAEWLRDLPDPAKRASLTGIMAVLTRIRDDTTASQIRLWNETNAIGRLEASVGGDLPGWLEAGVDHAAKTGLWVGAVREAQVTAQTAYITAVVRDRRDELSGMPVDPECGWLGTFREFTELSLWDHARETTFLPFSVDAGELDGSGMLFGGQDRWWSAGGEDQERIVMRFL